MMRAARCVVLSARPRCVFHRVTARQIQNSIIYSHWFSRRSCFVFANLCTCELFRENEQCRNVTTLRRRKLPTGKTATSHPCDDGSATVSCRTGALLVAEQSEFPRIIAIESNAREGRINGADDVSEGKSFLSPRKGAGHAVTACSSVESWLWHWPSLIDCLVRAKDQVASGVDCPLFEQKANRRRRRFQNKRAWSVSRPTLNY